MVGKKSKTSCCLDLFHETKSCIILGNEKNMNAIKYKLYQLSTATAGFLRKTWENMLLFESLCPIFALVGHIYRVAMRFFARLTLTFAK